MTGWDDLDRELDAWGGEGRSATLWWRDDDARRPGEALDRLADAAGGQGIPVALAVIPEGAEAGLAGALATPPGWSVLQHGYAHQNHAPPGRPKMELGAHRPYPMVLGELATGRDILERLFGPRLLPVVVPPWNRIVPALVAVLPEIGYAGLSTYQPRGAALAAPRLVQVNTHVDVIDWPGSRGFVGEGAALGLAAGHLRARRLGHADAAEPTGLLTHHLAHDEATWAFLSAFARRTAAHPAVRWLSAAEAFGTDGAA